MSLSALAHPGRRRRPARLVAGLAMLGLVAGSLLATGSTAQAAVPGPPKSFAGSGFGAIPDGPDDCDAFGAARDVAFTVTGMTGPPTDVRVTGLTFSPEHTYAGDITVTLLAPNGVGAVLFGLTGNDRVESSALTGPYSFADDAPGAWWAAAAAAENDAAVPPGAYRTSQIGSFNAVVSPTTTGPSTNLTAAFAGVTNPNGTWTLRVTDGCDEDTGGVSAASLVLRSDCATQQAALAPAQVRSAAAAAAVAAQAASVKKATAKVKKAKKADKPAQAKKKAVKKAKKKLKSVKKVLAAAQVTQNVATVALASAQTSFTSCTT